MRIRNVAFQILGVFYSSLSEDPTFTETDLYEPCGLTLPPDIMSVIQRTHEDTNILRGALKYLKKKDYITAIELTPSGSFENIKITVEGVDYYEEQSKSYWAKVFDQIKSPKQIADFFYFIAGLLIGAAITYLLK